MATSAQAKSAPQFGDAMPEAKKYQPIPRERMKELSQDQGPIMSIVLEDDQTIEEGVQDVRRWQHLGPRLTMYQWLRVANDSGSMVRFMEVEKIHGTPGSGLRALTLRDLWAPKFKDLAIEPIVSTGEWYVRHGGTHRKWMVIQPNGGVRRDGINTEAEAQNMARLESGNPKA
jgi:hypothetical protein